MLDKVSIKCYIPQDIESNTCNESGGYRSSMGNRGNYRTDRIMFYLLVCLISQYFRFYKQFIFIVVTL
jgi:hypothetical protein